MSFGMKDIHDAIKDVKITGHQRDDIEAFVINTMDLHELFESARFQMGMGMGIGAGEDLKISGIKIIESHHVPRGTIFKVFKDENRKYPPEWGYDEYGNNYAPGHPAFSYVSKTLSGAAQEVEKLDGSTKQAANAIENIPMMEEKKEPRHSITRKVELD